MKEFPDYYKVQFLFKDPWHDGSVYREIYYRALPSQLNLWDRIFNNPWQQIQFILYSDKLHPWFSPKEYHEIIEPMETLGDVRRFLEKQNARLDAIHNEKIEKREIWPDGF